MIYDRLRNMNSLKIIPFTKENYKEIVTKTTENQKSIFEGIDSIKTDFKEMGF